ncbi:hypothetical protein GGR54DRAFT_643036 [Hypoxylon sp. NC1633]|nr:hypothetical protein GGR54DRAFT_643036 [Hypoxylon sp. NC1633]
MASYNEVPEAQSDISAFEGYAAGFPAVDGMSTLLQSNANGSKPITDPPAPQPTSSWGAKELGVRLHSPDPPQYPCDYCEAGFNRRDKLVDHQKGWHKIQTPSKLALNRPRKRKSSSTTASTAQSDLAAVSCPILSYPVSTRLEPGYGDLRQVVLNEHLASQHFHHNQNTATLQHSIEPYAALGSMQLPGAIQPQSPMWSYLAPGFYPAPGSYPALEPYATQGLYPGTGSYAAPESYNGMQIQGPDPQVSMQLYQDDGQSSSMFRERSDTVMYKVLLEPAFIVWRV